MERMAFKLALQPKTLYHKDGQIFWLCSPKNLYVFFFFFHFFVIILSLSYNYYYDQKTGVALFDGFKTELRLTLDPPQIDMFKIGILIWKTTYIGFW